MSDLEDDYYLNEKWQPNTGVGEREYFRFLAQMRHRKLRKFALLTGLFLVPILFAFSYFLFTKSDSSLLKVPLILMTAGVFSGLALVYLSPSSTARDSRFDRLSPLHVRAYIDERVGEALALSRRGNQESLEFSDEDKATILAKIQAKLESDALQGYVNGIKEIALARAREETLDDRLQQTRRRLGQEVQDLARRGNLNLILGILTTVSGLSVLGYSVFSPPVTASTTELLSYFAPRVSLVVLIEVFAYFFLRLYKKSLDEIKYFQNELTNTEAKNLALHVALRDEDTKLRAQVIRVLATTERNFVLEKDQTTVEIEKERLAAKNVNSFSEAIAKILKEAKPG